MINRREFLKTTLIALLPIGMSEKVKELELERCLEDTKFLDDREFVAYIMIQTNLYIHNPRMCGYIDNIGE